MKKRSMKVLAGTLTMALAVSLAPAPGAQAAKKVSMSKKLTVVAGKSKKLKLKNNKKKVKWKVTSGKKVIALKAKKKTGVTIVGKKKGNAKVRAKIGKKTYTCKVKVKAAAKKPVKTTKPVVMPTVAPTLAPTPKPTVAPTLAPTASPTATPTGTPAVEENNYNEEDVKQLKALITELQAAGATVSEDLDDEEQYGWDENGYLSEIDWNHITAISGDFKVPAFSKLTYLDISGTDITSLDCTACTELEYLDCSDSTKLANLNVSTCTKLEELYCEGTALTEIDLSNCLSLTADGFTGPDEIKIIGWAEPLYDEVQALAHIIDKQLENGASPDISLRDETGNLNPEIYKNEDMYTWNEQGHLTWLTLDTVGLNGDLSLTEFPYLEGIDVSMNELTSLDVSGCSRLEYLYCNDNVLTSLKLTGCSALTELDCSNNKLTTLDLSPCKELDLEGVSYEGNEGISVTTEDDTGDDFGI